MLLPLSALEEYIKIKISPEKLAEKLLLSGTKVESIKKTKSDTIFELEITPNRADTLSFYGIAREVAAVLKLDLNEPDTTYFSRETPKNSVSFKVLDKKLCPQYSIVKLDGIVIKDSPLWIKEILESSGIRALNNVIDITNLVMLELGSPMHAFDASKINGTMKLRASKNGEKIQTLDSIERVLPENAIIIEDETKIIDLAGLMGGASSDIDETTTEIVLLVPIYDPVQIRKTSLFTNLRTEASNRFEKKLDPNMHPTAIARAIKLLIENASAKVASRITTIGFPTQSKKIDFDFSLVRKVLGLDLNIETVIDILIDLGFRVSSQPLNDNILSVTIPSFRPDVSIQEDLLEEIGRIYGYNNFPRTLPSGEVPVQIELFEDDAEKKVRDLLVNLGFFETTGYSLVSAFDLDKFNLDKNKSLKVLHPTSRDFEYLRPTLLINLIYAVKTNEARENLAFFEVAKIFSSKQDQKTKLPTQDLSLAFVSNESLSISKAKLEKVLKSFTTKIHLSKIEADPHWDFGTKYTLDAREVAQIGYLQKQILNNFELSGDFVFAYIDFEYLKTKNLNLLYKPNPKFPSVIEDMSFFLPEGETAFEVLSLVRKFHPLIHDANIIDSYKKGSKTSITVRIIYNHKDKTLENREVSDLRKKLEKRLVTHFKIEIRKD